MIRENNSPAIHILLAEDEPDLRSTLAYNLRRSGYVVTPCSDGQEAWLYLSNESSSPVDVIISDIMMPHKDGYWLAKNIREHIKTKHLPLMFLTAKGESFEKVEGFRAGADDYLTKPFDIEELLARVHVQARRAHLVRQLRMDMASTPSTNSREKSLDTIDLDIFSKVTMWEQRFPELAAIRRDSIVGSSSNTLQLLREILLRAPGSDPVLIIGETGTGKTGVAEAIHRLGPRSNAAFRVVNCAELAAADGAIISARLFGVGKNSGLVNVSKEGMPGLLEECHHGTLFLDEIHRLPLAAQAMLLLPIENRPFHVAVGKADPKTVDVKFILATNVDLKEEVRLGNFPEDLYQRLAQSIIHVPSLNDRPEDIPILAQHFLEECKEECGIPDATLSPHLLNALQKRPYEGNIRELRSTVRDICRRAAFDGESFLTVDHLSIIQSSIPHTTTATIVEPSTPLNSKTSTPLGDSFWHASELQKLEVLRRHRFKISAAEHELGLSQKSRTLTNYLRAFCFKALAASTIAPSSFNSRPHYLGFDLTQATRRIVGIEDKGLIERTEERCQSYLDSIVSHIKQHTTELLYNNLPKDYKSFVDIAIDKVRDNLTH